MVDSLELGAIVSKDNSSDSHNSVYYIWYTMEVFGQSVAIHLESLNRCNYLPKHTYTIGDKT